MEMAIAETCVLLPIILLCTAQQTIVLKPPIALLFLPMLVTPWDLGQARRDKGITIHTDPLQVWGVNLGGECCSL